MTQAYPLQWPEGRARTRMRIVSKFKVTHHQAFEEMHDELRRFQAGSVVVSSNIPLRQDGTPYRDGLKELLPDPGVAVYFTRKKRLICLQCDQYQSPWENMRAIGLAIESFRSMERHGAGQVLDQAFEGFTALPAPGSSAEPDQAAWWVVLGCGSNADPGLITAAYRDKCRQAGGATRELNAAKEAGFAARGVTS